MKIIDLLNKIANGEEVPKKLKIKKWEYNGKDENLEYELFDRLYEEDFELNDEVEILEEEKKIPEKIDINFDYIEFGKMLSCVLSTKFSYNEKVIINKINEIIDYFKSKGE